MMKLRLRAQDGLSSATTFQSTEAAEAWGVLDPPQHRGEGVTTLLPPQLPGL